MESRSVVAAPQVEGRQETMWLKDDTELASNEDHMVSSPQSFIERYRNSRYNVPAAKIPSGETLQVFIGHFLLLIRVLSQWASLWSV